MMKPDDYVIPEPADDYTGLIDHDGAPYPDRLRGPRASLARVAAAIHAEAPHLNADDCEQVVRWMKLWKFDHQPRHDREPFGPSSFSEIVQQIKNSREQIDLQNTAVRDFRRSHAWTAAAGAIVGIAFAGFIFSVVPWYLSALGIAAAYWAYKKKGVSPILDAANTWKEQEQLNLWLAVRAATTIQELNIAGLFAYLPDTEHVPGKKLDEEKAVKAFRAERERLADALYRDPTWFLWGK
jgi:hypothetical protein